MRIPSQLDRDNLYRRENRSRGGGEALRKIVRLAVALALVVVLMGQAGRPEFYEAFFPNTGARDRGGEAASHPDRPAGGALPAATDKAPTPQMKQTAVALVARLSDRQRRAATVALTGLHRQTERRAAQSDRRSGSRGTADPESGDASEGGEAWGGGDASDASDAADGADAADSSSGSAAPVGGEGPVREETLAVALSGALEQVLGDGSARDRWQQSVRRADRGGELAPADRQRLAALDAALESAALGRVVDGSTWRAGDTEAFYRYLNRAPYWQRSSGAPLAGVLPLLQQPDVYRGSLLRVAGRVARVERVRVTDQAAADFGVDEYWQLWLRPDDGTTRPVLAVVPRVPDAIAALESDSLVEQGPAVTVLGKFFKRLAYRSAAGADLAPVVVGRLGGMAVEAERSADPQEEPAERGDSATLVWILLIALLVGVGLSAVAMWQTARVARRLREIRRTKRPEPNRFFQQLADVESAPGAPRETNQEPNREKR